MNLRRRLGAFALVILTGCGPARVVTEIQRDSVLVQVRDSVILRDTVVMAAIPEETDRAILPDSDTSYLSTSLAESWAYAHNGQIHHRLRNRSEMLLPVRVQYVDHARTEQSHRIGWRQIVETVEVEKELSRWQNFVMTLGYVALAACAAWLAWKLSKVLRTFS